MALLQIARLGNPVLRQPSGMLEPEDIARDSTQRLIDDMIQTMRESDGVGLAAPQVHQPLSIIVFEVSKEVAGKGRPEVPLTVLVNTRITWTSTDMDEDWEGCLSVPDIRGRVPRHVQIAVEGLDRHGNPVKTRYDGFPARVVQHEHDHTEGRVFLDRMESLESLTFVREYERFWLEGGPPR